MVIQVTEKLFSWVHCGSLERMFAKTYLLLNPPPQLRFWEDFKRAPCVYPFTLCYRDEFDFDSGFYNCQHCLSVSDISSTCYRIGSVSSQHLHSIHYWSYVLESVTLMVHVSWHLYLHCFCNLHLVVLQIQLNANVERLCCIVC